MPENFENGMYLNINHERSVLLVSALIKLRKSLYVEQAGGPVLRKKKIYIQIEVGDEKFCVG
jgi:hypothetical protein